MSIRRRVVRCFHVSDAALVKIEMILIVVIFVVMALNDVILKKKFKYANELVSGEACRV